MRKRYLVPLNTTFIAIIICSLFLVSYFFMYKESYGMNVVVNYPISTNYETSEIIDDNNYKNIEFSVTNSSNKEAIYYISFDEVESNYDFLYTLSYSGNKTSGDFKNGDITEGILIAPKDTHHLELSIDNYETGKIFNGKIEVNTKAIEEQTFSQTILINNNVKENSLTLIGKNIATTDEGLVKNNEDNSYFFRGNVTNNYVKFNDLIWRILTINKDGSVKLVLDSEIDVLSTYYDDKYEYNNSVISKSIDKWYTDNFISNDIYVKKTSFCNDNSYIGDDKTIYAPFNRLVNDKMATTTCLGETYETKAGLLTADEVAYAGGVYNAKNDNYFLVNKKSKTFYTISGGKYEKEIYYPMAVNSNGSIECISGKLYRSIKPTINLKKNIQVTGSGEVDDPYQIIK